MGRKRSGSRHLSQPPMRRALPHARSTPVMFAPASPMSPSLDTLRPFSLNMLVTQWTTVVPTATLMFRDLLRIVPSCCFPACQCAACSVPPEAELKSQRKRPPGWGGLVSAESATGLVAHDGLQFQELVEAVGTPLATVAGLLVAAKGRPHIRRRTVQVNHAGAHA